MNQNRLEELKLNEDVKVSKSGRPILGTLEGPCADFIDSTRNDRMYDEELWETVFSDPLVKEQLDAGGIPGELDHPTDRTETDSSKIAIMMPEAPKKNKNGKLVAKFDILDTPNGRIAYTLAKYGYKLGISSRGSGDTYTGRDGKEHVDKDTYDFKGFDLVLIPAVKAARLNLVTESLSSDKGMKLILDEGVKMALTEALNNSSDEEKQIMNETLQNLNIDLTAGNSEDTYIADTNNTTAEDNGENVIRDLQKLLKENRELTKQVEGLQKQLSVCYTKEANFTESISTLGGRVTSLTETLGANQSKVTTLSEQIETKNSLIEKLEAEDVKSKQTIKTMIESISSKDAQIKGLSAKVTTLKEEVEKTKTESEKALVPLRENIREMTKDSVIKKSEFTTKLNEAKAQIDKYKAIAQTAVDKYIKSQAIMLGVTPQEIKSKLSESYSFNDIDRACNSLKSYKLNISSLPFDANQKSSIKMKVTESVEPIVKNNFGRGVDDEPDAQLIGLAEEMTRKSPKPKN